MAICVHCTTYIPSLWTVYSSATNVRLSLCPTCHQFADPYVEQPLLVLALDLVLMNAEVYRHLLFNRGTPPMKVGQSEFGESGDETSKEKGPKDIVSDERKEVINQILMHLTIVTVFSESYLRWATVWSNDDTNRMIGHSTSFVRCLVVSFMDSLVFQGSITLAIISVLAVWRLFTRGLNSHRDSCLGSIFLLTKLTPLSIQLSSCPKLVLLLLVSIWRPELATSSSSITMPTSSPPFPMHHLSQVFKSYTTHSFSPLVYQIIRSFPVSFGHLVQSLTEGFETIDREHVIRTVLGGLGAGFGLSVLLRPILIDSPRDISIDFREKSIERVKTESSEKNKDGEEGPGLKSKKRTRSAMRAWLDSIVIISLVLWGYISQEYVFRFMIG